VDFAAWSLTKNRGGVQVEPGGQGYLTKADDKSSSYWIPGTVEVSGGGGSPRSKGHQVCLGGFGADRRVIPCIAGHIWSLIFNGR